MRKAGHIVAEVLDVLRDAAKPGVSTADLDRIASRYADTDEPGVMWRVADEVRTVLTPAQIEQLRERPRVERRRRDGEPRLSRRGERRSGDEAGRMRRERHAPRDGARRGEPRMRRMEHGVAEQHREAARALAEQHREQMRALHAEREAGTIDEDAFAERARALREEMRADMEPLMTDEARRMRAEMMELHERMRAVRDDVLRLSEEQRAAMQERTRRSREAGARDPMSMLSEEQRATIAVHRALMRGAHAPDGGRPRQMER